MVDSKDVPAAGQPANQPAGAAKPPAKRTAPQPVRGKEVVQSPTEPEDVRRPFISEGVRNDIELHGETIDPFTGQRLTREDLP